MRDRPVLPDGIGVERSQPAIVFDSPGPRGNGRVEVPPEIQKRLAKVVGGSH
jgi:hypothetical protein